MGIYTKSARSTLEMGKLPRYKSSPVWSEMEISDPKRSSRLDMLNMDILNKFTVDLAIRNSDVENVTSLIDKLTVIERVHNTTSAKTSKGEIGKNITNIISLNDGSDGNKNVKKGKPVYDINKDIVVSLVAVTTKYRSKWLFRTVKCPGTNRTISFKDGFTNDNFSKVADVLIFTTPTSIKHWQTLLRERNPRQIWLYSTPESAFTSPPTASRKRELEDLQFNMTFGYHSKSEVYAPFGAYIPFNVSIDFPTNVTTGKSPEVATVSWASSHCHHSYWNRTALVYFLSKFIDIEMYGGCGNHKIPRNSGGSKILRTHRFYLAFENTCCSEYITEKFWKALAQYESVPIVIGAKKSEYMRLAPPNSFIYADDFEKIEDLAKYVKKVAGNATLYRKYHEWRKDGKVEVYTNKRVFPFCRDEKACDLLLYLENNAWRKEPLITKVDPYGPDWLGSCKACGKHKWLKDFGQSEYSFLD
ncbi:alpha-(1,3)-fucosyltransferase fut-1-like [Apostichopus japonicus]|uniref:alpha-(1,3)-fucosyltransferase fut-1-like n=1 Tax=Stichopus japonicus TaxID=307972 RepID=UPI003AB44B5D